MFTRITSFMRISLMKIPLKFLSIIFIHVHIDHAFTSLMHAYITYENIPLKFLSITYLFTLVHLITHSLRSCSLSRIRAFTHSHIHFVHVLMCECVHALGLGMYYNDDIFMDSNLMDDPAPQFEDPPLYNMQPPLGMPIPTPASNPQTFQSMTYVAKPPPQRLGNNVKGPDILFRILMGLRSGVRKECEWCLTTLLTFTTAHNPDILRTRTDILSLVVKYINDNFTLVSQSKSTFDDTEEILLTRSKLLEALLIMRNVCIDLETAEKLAKECQPFVIKGILLPKIPIYDEMRLLCLEVCEHICYHNVDVDSGDGMLKLLPDLLKLLHSKDKKVLLSTLRSISRLLVFAVDFSFENVEIKQVLKLLVIDDSELQACVLEFFQQVTNHISKVDLLAELVGGDLELKLLVRRLVCLTTFKMDREPSDYIRLPRRTRKLAPVVPPPIPPQLMQQLLRMPEPERTTAWIRCSYDLDPEGEVLQVSLWTAYQRLFGPHERDGTGHRMPPALDFIRTCYTNVKGAQARVITTPEGQKKFIIKGLVPRETALSLDTPANDGSSDRAPPLFGEVAASSLLNIARMQGGKKLIEPLVPQIVENACLNGQVFEKVDRLLSVVAK